jgi:cysteine desulfurase
MQKESIYLDYAATTPVDPRVIEAMRPYFDRAFGNPSSIHQWGQKAEAAVEDARESIAALLNCAPTEIIFTSCGSESDNLALRGASFKARFSRGANHILVSPVDHHAVLRTAQQLADDHNFELELLPVDPYGRVSPDDLKDRLRDDTAIVSIIYANNEIGTVNDIPRLAQVCREQGIPFHTDAVQAASQLPIDVHSMGIDMVSIGAHKFYGPKGVGALIVHSDLDLIPSLTGGGQERSRRAGTHNVPYIVGMAKALEITVAERESHNKHYRELRDKVMGEILGGVRDAKLTGHAEERLPNHASFVFQHLDGNQLLIALDVEGFGCSSGSACKTGEPEPSDVLTAIGLPRAWALGSLRVTVGRPTREEDIARFLEILPEVLDRVRIPQK